MIPRPMVLLPFDPVRSAEPSRCPRCGRSVYAVFTEMGTPDAIADAGSIHRLDAGPGHADGAAGLLYGERHRCDPQPGGDR